MRRIFTSTFFVAAFVVASFNSFGQCTITTTVDFNSGTSTQGFTGRQTSGTGSFTPLAVNSQQLRTVATANSTNTYVITSATYSIPAIAPINFTFTYGDGTQAAASVQYAIRYMNTSNVIVQTTPQDYVSGTCTSVTRPADMSGNSFQIVAIYTVTDGNGNPSNGYIFLDNFGTNGVAASSALPVKFQNLDAKAASNSVSLKWSVGTEDNVSSYQIEKSADGRSYATIGSVNATGDGTYSFTDSKPTSVAYYRIKSVDIDGKYGYSTVAMVKAGNSVIVLKAFPTPFVNNLSIQHPTAVAGSSIIISSADGRVIKTVVPAVGMQQTDINLSSAKSGLYVIRYSSLNGDSETLKVVKQ